jgi:hypothetical protein
VKRCSDVYVKFVDSLKPFLYLGKGQKKRLHMSSPLRGYGEPYSRLEETTQNSVLELDHDSWEQCSLLMRTMIMS